TTRSTTPAAAPPPPRTTACSSSSSSSSPPPESGEVAPVVGPPERGRYEGEEAGRHRRPRRQPVAIRAVAGGRRVQRGRIRRRPGAGVEAGHEHVEGSEELGCGEGAVAGPVDPRLAEKVG